MSDTDIEETRRPEFLSKLYELAKGSPREVDISKLRRELGLDIKQTQEIGLFLDAEGLVTIALFGDLLDRIVHPDVRKPLL